MLLRAGWPEIAAAGGDIDWMQLSVDEPSELFIYYNTRSIMGTTGQDSGVDNRSLFQALANNATTAILNATLYRQATTDPAIDCGGPFARPAVSTTRLRLPGLPFSACSAAGFGFRPAGTVFSF